MAFQSDSFHGVAKKTKARAMDLSEWRGEVVGREHGGGAAMAGLGDAREVSVSFLVGYPKWKVRCSTAAVSSSKDAEVEYRSRRTQR